jgi:hypothetical protein
MTEGRVLMGTSKSMAQLLYAAMILPDHHVG